MPAIPLTRDELEFVQELKDIGVLRKIRNFDDTYKGGFVFCVCGDCDRFPELYRYQKNKCKEAGYPIRSHLIALNGGPLLIANNSPLNTDGESKIIKKHIAGAMQIKSIETIVAMFHWQCGAALNAGMSIEETFACYYNGIQELQSAHPDARIITKCHLHKPEEFSSYIINMDRYQEVYRKTAAA